MALSATTPLFYATRLTKAEVFRLAAGVVEPPALEVIDFPEVEGGDVQRELAVPFLPGMDEIEVEQARLRVRTGRKEREVTDYTVTAVPAGHGITLSIPQPGRLKKLELTYPSPTAVPGAPHHVIIRTPPEGPPTFAAPPLPKPGPLYDDILTGLTVQDLGGDRKLLLLPSVLGNAWRIQLALGDTPDKLTTVPFSPTVNRVVLDTAPRDVSVTLSADTEEIPLWGHPDLLLPDAGEQEISFTPLAQRHLNQQLQAKRDAPDQATLPVPLRFHSASSGALEVVAKTLTAHYVVKPLGKDPVTQRVGGEWTVLTLRAPAGLRPINSRVKLTVKFLGRALNRGSLEPPLALPSMGLRVHAQRSVARMIAFLPEPPAVAGSVLPLASVRLYVAALAEAEAVLEVRGDVAGAPGPVLVASVQQLGSGSTGWVEFILPSPLPVSTGQAPLWLALRVTKGEVLWFVSPLESASHPMGADMTSARVSSDRGQTWSEPTGNFGDAGVLLAQCFHELPELSSPPVLRVRHAEALMTDNLLLNVKQKGAKEYIVEVSLPDGVHGVLAAAAGSGRTDTALRLFSPSMLDVTVEDLTLSYDPFRVGGVEGG
jgi:hypothetical protein